VAEIRGCEFPDDLMYDTELNVWFRDSGGGQFEAGLTAFGLALVGDLYMFNPRPVGRQIETNKAFALVEVAKTVLSVRTPFGCVIAEINTPLETTPFKVNRSPYMNWLVRLEPDNSTQARSVLLSGTEVAVRANELMDLHGMTSLADFKRTSGAS
jgi:glycine cleavage system H protein